MALHFADRWIWDFWLCSDGDVHHVFYLQAPTSIGDPEQRHWNVSIGHATSSDLNEWTPVADALSPGRPGTFDDLTTWTGSVIRRDREWIMVYTGTARADRGLVQRVGVATSPDLLTWTRVDGAVLAADPAHYDLLDIERWGDEAWRDPWAFVDPDDGRIHVLLTARAGPGNRFERGVIGHARTVDLLTWEVLPPLDVRATGFGQLEVPQLFQFADRWYLLVSSDTTTQSPTRRVTGPGTGTYYLVADDPAGPFEMIGDGALAVDPIGSSYAGRVHTDSDGVAWFLDWERSRPDGSFVGRLSRPRQLHARRDGSLYLDVATA